MRSERAVDRRHPLEGPALRVRLDELVDLVGWSIDAVDDLAGVQPRRLALGLARGPLRLVGEHLRDRQTWRMSAE